MKRVALLVCTCVLIHAVTAQAQEHNILLNGSFEGVGFSGWEDWNSFASSRIRTNTAVARSGHQLLDLRLNPGEEDGGFVQNLWQREGLAWGDTLEASVWVRTDKLRGQKAFLLIEFFDEDWELAGRVESDRVTGTTPWRNLRVKATVPSAIQWRRLNRINVALALHGERDGGLVIFDDAVVRKVN